MFLLEGNSRNWLRTKDLLMKCHTRSPSQSHGEPCKPSKVIKRGRQKDLIFVIKSLDEVLLKSTRTQCLAGN